MNRFGHMKFADNKIAEVNEKVEASKQVMKDNVQKVIDRGDNIETLIEKTDILVQRSDSFRVNTKTLERKLWWKNVKMWIILICVIIFLIWLIFSLVCGFNFGCISGAPKCFHESTQITYKGKKFSMKELEHSSECMIPHIVSANGVKISTTCSSKPLRLTNEHLVFTNIGVRHASTLLKGDILFSDVGQLSQCIVTEVSKEENQKYFGLNCIESIVLAKNVLCSTFGNYHRIPAAWMSWMGHYFGIEKASRWGDSIAVTLAGLNLL